MTTYRVYHQVNGEWRQVPFTAATLQYCHGYVDAMDSLYPSRPHRIVKESRGAFKIIRETPGRSAPHTS